jgi:S-DNA-T family DNA segregation ATPase FtsK/SpoIIIE
VRRNAMAWLLFPLALFPLVALLTYDWRAMPELNLPPVPSSNWIGALGDCFAYYGYLLFGLAIWILPVVCVVAALCMVLGRRMRPGRRELWFCVFLACVSALLQAVGSGGAVARAAHAVNIANPGGAIGYLAMTRCLSPLLSDFGAAMLVAMLLCGSLLGAVGMRNMKSMFSALFRWAMAGHEPRPPADGENDEERQRYLAAMQAREEAKRQREEEKARIRAEKEAAKEAKRAEKEAAREAKANARAAAQAQQQAPAPVQPAQRGAPAPRRQEAGEPAAPEEKGPYLLPPMSLLNPLKKSDADHGDVDEMSERLISTLKLFGVDATLAYTIQGPVVTKYALRLAPGIRYSSVTNISDNLMGALHAKSLRIEAPIPGEECVGIEVPNRAPAGISFREIIESDAWRKFKGELPLLFGKDAAGRELIADLASMPHMLVAGATGQGKSVCLNAIINGLLMTKTPEQLKLIMVDPKSVEFSSYASLPHLIVPVITDNKKVVFSLHWAVAEMEKRLKLFARARVKNIYDFNNRLQFTQTDMFGNDTAVGSDMPRTVPYIVIIIDEVADLMASSAKEVVPDISRLTAKARAAGIHLILATQRPDAKVITGTIKANIPGRVAFKTATSIDSRTILDDTGAENLIGRGDMLFKSKEGLLIRAQGAWISDPEIAHVVQFIEQHSNQDFDPRFAKKLETIKDEEVDLFADPEADAQTQRAAAAEQKAQVKADAEADDFKKAVECVINTGRASTSHFQRQMGWGYNHAAKILDLLTERGVVSPPQGMGPRQIVMSQEELLAVFNGGDSGAAPDAAQADAQPAAEQALFTQEGQQ